MPSPAAVALTPRLAALFRLDMPAADSLGPARMLRMGNLGPGMPRSRGKGAKPCRFADHPTAPVTPRPQLVAIARNGWSRSIGTGGRDRLEEVVAINRKRWSRSAGARILAETESAKVAKYNNNHNHLVWREFCYPQAHPHHIRGLLRTSANACPYI